MESSFSSAEEFLFHCEGYDICLLDIEMKGMDGVTLAKKIRQGSKGVQIVFITGYSDYILQGYEVEALHYLVKPLSAEKLCIVLDRAIEKQRMNARMLDIECAGEIVRLPLYEIVYLDVQKNNVTIHTEDAQYILRRSLTSLEEELSKAFLRWDARSSSISDTFEKSQRPKCIWQKISCSLYREVRTNRSIEQLFGVRCGRKGRDKI